MYSLKTIQEANYKLNEPNALDAAVGDALKTPAFIRRRNEKLGIGAAEEPKKKTRRGKGRGRSKPNEEPKKKTSPIDGAVGDPALARQRRNVESGLGKIVDEERNKKTRRGKGRGRSKSNNVSAEDHNSHVDARKKYERAKMAAINSDAHVKVKERHDQAEARKAALERIETNKGADRAKFKASASAVDDKTPAFIRRRNEKLGLAVDDKTPAFIRRRNEKLGLAVDDKTPAFIRRRNEKLGLDAAEGPIRRGRFKSNNVSAAKAKLKAGKADAGLATNMLAGKIDKPIKDNKPKAAINADAHVSARKKHLENKAKTSKQRKNRGAIAAAGLAAAGGLIHQNSDAIKSAYDDI